MASIMTSEDLLADLVIMFEKLKICDAEPTAFQSYASFEAIRRHDHQLNICEYERTWETNYTQFKLSLVEKITNNGKRNIEMTYCVEYGELIQKTYKHDNSIERKAIDCKRKSGLMISGNAKGEPLEKIRVLDEELTDSQSNTRQDMKDESENKLDITSEEVPISGDNQFCTDMDAPKTAQKYEIANKSSATVVTGVNHLGEASYKEQNEILNNYYKFKINHLQNMEKLKTRSVVAKENISTQISKMSIAMCKLLTKSEETEED